MEYKNIPLHDAILEKIEYEWESHSILISGRLPIHQSTKFELCFKGVSSLEFPHQEKWGPSSSINDLSLSNNVFTINMQSGDIINIVADEFWYDSKVI